MIHLTPDEALQAANVGCRRNAFALSKGYQHRNNGKGDGWQWHVQGACGEMAVGKALDLHWSGHVGKTDQHDVGPYEVRTVSNPTGELPFRKGDPLNAVYILVIRVAPLDYQLVGWIYGHDCLVKGRLYDPTGSGRDPAHFVKQADLEPMATLPPPTATVPPAH